MKRVGDFKMELVRKAVHVLTGVFIVLAFKARLLDVWLFGLILIVYAAVMLWNAKAERELLTRIISINRADAAVPGLDILFYFIGCWIVLALFGGVIAYASILILAFGDAIAHIISRSFGATQTVVTRTTYLEGTVVGIIAATLAAWLEVLFIPALVASTVAMLVEAGELRIGDHHVDDNLVIPIVAGLTLWLMAFVLPIV